jgi:hypothetical protein
LMPPPFLSLLPRFIKLPPKYHSHAMQIKKWKHNKNSVIMPISVWIILKLTDGMSSLWNLSKRALVFLFLWQIEQWPGFDCKSYADLNLTAVFALAFLSRFAL